MVLMLVLWHVDDRVRGIGMLENNEMAHAARININILWHVGCRKPIRHYHFFKFQTPLPPIAEVSKTPAPGINAAEF